MSQLTEFYAGTGLDSRGRTLDGVLAFTDGEFEDVHDFIQWLFPLAERSRYNPDAPLLTAADADAFRSDPALRANLLRAFARFLRFVGLEWDGDRVVAGPGFAGKAAVWQFPNHNWLRVTRVLGSTRRLGLEAESRAFFDCLGELRASGRSRVTDDTLAYWRDAAGVS